jgi:hypothetical protein
MYHWQCSVYSVSQPVLAPLLLLDKVYLIIWQTFFVVVHVGLADGCFCCACWVCVGGSPGLG